MLNIRATNNLKDEKMGTKGKLWRDGIAWN